MIFCVLNKIFLMYIWCRLMLIVMQYCLLLLVYSSFVDQKNFYIHVSTLKFQKEPECRQA